MDVKLPTVKPKTLEEIEREAVIASLKRHNGNRSRVCRELIVSPDWLRKRCKEWNIPPGKNGRPKTA